MKVEWKKYLCIGFSVFLLYLCVHYWDVFARAVGIAFHAAAPLITGCVIAYIINILMNFYEQHFFPKSQKKIVRRSARPLSMLAAFLTLALILTLVIWLVVPELISCVKLLVSEVPGAMQRFTDWLSGWGVLSEDIEAYLLSIDWQSLLLKTFDFLKNGIGDTFNYAVEAISSVVSSVVNLVIGTIFAVYLLVGKEKLSAQCNKLLAAYVRPSFTEKFRYVLSVVNDSFHRYIVGQCTEAVILGVLCTVGMLIFQFPYAVMTGAVIGVTALIPVAGAYIGGAVGFLLIFSKNPMMAFLFILYLVILQQLENNLIYPRVVGSSIGLPGIWVLTAVTIGGGLFGVSGMLIGVPLAAACYQLVRRDLQVRTPALAKGVSAGPKAGESDE